jgi:hypothetical protein
MACNPGEPHGDASRGNSGPGRVPVGKLFGAFLRTGTGDAPMRRGNVTLRGRNRFGTGSVFGGSDGVATRFSGLSVSGVGWRGDTLLRSRAARRYCVTSFGRRTNGRIRVSQGRRRPRRRPSAHAADNVKRGRLAERSHRLRGRNEPLKGETHGRYRRETEPEGFREEQRARRLRKPEGAAQPGEANPVQVASRCLMRRRVNQPHEGSVVRRRLVSGHRAVRRNTVDHTLERSPSSREDGKVLRVPDRRVFREYLKGRFARPRP